MRIRTLARRAPELLYPRKAMLPPDFLNGRTHESIANRVNISETVADKIGQKIKVFRPTSANLETARS